LTEKKQSRRPHTHSQSGLTTSYISYKSKLLCTRQNHAEPNNNRSMTSVGS